MTHLEAAAAAHYLKVMKHKEEKGLEYPNMASFKDGARFVIEQMEYYLDNYTTEETDRARFAVFSTIADVHYKLKQFEEE